MPKAATSLRLPDAVRTLLEAHFQGADVELPMLPTTAAEALAMCEDPEANAKDLAELLNRDQSIAVQVLRLANSAAYAPAEPIVSLQQAVSRLGMGTVREITMAIALKGSVFRVPGYGVHVREMWIHSAATAAYAKEVARLMRRNVESAFMCGLLHDIGRPIVLQSLVNIAARRGASKVPDGILDLAMQDFHAGVGGLLLERWGMPAWMRDAALHHHDPRGSEEFEGDVQITALADMLGHWALDRERTQDDFPSEHEVVEALDLYASDLVGLFEMRDAILDIAESFT